MGWGKAWDRSSAHGRCWDTRLDLADAMGWAFGVDYFRCRETGGSAAL